MGADLSRLRPHSLSPAVVSSTNSPVFRPTAMSSPSELNDADRAAPTSSLATRDCPTKRPLGFSNWPHCGPRLSYEQKVRTVGKLAVDFLRLFCVRRWLTSWYADVLSSHWEGAWVFGCNQPPVLLQNVLSRVLVLVLCRRPTSSYTDVLSLHWEGVRLFDCSQPPALLQNNRDILCANLLHGVERTLKFSTGSWPWRRKLGVINDNQMSVIKYVHTNTCIRVTISGLWKVTLRAVNR